MTSYRDILMDSSLPVVESARRTFAIEQAVARGIVRRIERLPQAERDMHMRHLAIMHEVRWNRVADEDACHWPAGRQFLREMWTLCKASDWLNTADVPDGAGDMFLWDNAVWEAAYYARYGRFGEFPEWMYV